jgi:4-carboxymuconolactone decarboxylase
MALVPPARLGDGEDARALVERIVAGRGKLGALYPVLLHSPRLAEACLEFGTVVRYGNGLEPRLRELVICLVGELCGARYEVHRHRELALASGASTEEVDGVREWRTLPGYSELERSALHLAETVTTTVQAEPSLVETLLEELGPRQLVELMTLVGYYNMICRILAPLGITPADEAGPEDVLMAPDND